eukprot:scaffold600497_cov38-Prasinocladus_malaysianus.AAC.1
MDHVAATWSSGNANSKIVNDSLAGKWPISDCNMSYYQYLEHHKFTISVYQRHGCLQRPMIRNMPAGESDNQITLFFYFLLLVDQSPVASCYL